MKGFVLGLTKFSKSKRFTTTLIRHLKEEGSSGEVVIWSIEYV